MNILVFSWRDPKHPMAGGAEQVMHEHMKGWVQAGHSVTLFSSVFEEAQEKENLDGVSIIRKGYQLLGVQIMAVFWYLFSRHPKFDLVVDQFHGLPFFAPLYVRAPKLAVLQEVAREVWLLNHLPKPFNWIIGWLGYLTEPTYFWFYKWTPFMIGSESAKLDLIKMGIPAKNITVVPHGVIINAPKILPSKERVNTIVFLGALARDKGIEDAIRAFSLLNKQGKFNFWVLGSGAPEYLDYLKKMASSLEIDKNIKFFGFVSEEKKFELLARAHVLINPSIREGWGLVNIEANRMKTPVVAYNVSGSCNSVKEGESGLLSEAGQYSILASNIIELLSKPEKFKKLQQTAYEWSNNFDWEKSRKLSLKLIESLNGRKN